MEAEIIGGQSVLGQMPDRINPHHVLANREQHAVSFFSLDNLMQFSYLEWKTVSFKCGWMLLGMSRESRDCRFDS